MTQPIKLNWTTTNQASVGTGLKVLVHGPAGVGKTTLCGTTGDPEGTLIVSAEAGLLSLRHVSIKAVEVTSLAELREVLRILRERIAQGRGSIRWVCLDSISEIAEVCLAAEKARNKDPRAAYGVLADQMFALLRDFRDLALNVVMLCKQGREQDADGRLLFGPSLPGKQLTNGIGYLFDEVFALRAFREGDAIVRSLQTATDGQYEAKDRSGALALYEPPDLAAIAAKILPPAPAAEPAETNEAA